MPAPEDQEAKIKALEALQFKNKFHEVMIDIAEEEMGIKIWERAKLPWTKETKAYIETYKQAVYEVQGLKKEPLVIGKPHPEVDELLEMYQAMGILPQKSDGDDRSGRAANKPVYTYAFLTAHNPMSEKQTEDENAARNQQLKKDLQRYPTQIGEGRSADGEWKEASFLILGIDFSSAKELARQHGQRAFLFGKKGEPITLQIRETDSSQYHPAE